ncbi:hypothetical protein AOLI_G00047980 [Acnodon oligacanthus]
MHLNPVNPAFLLSQLLFLQHVTAAAKQQQLTYWVEMPVMFYADGVVSGRQLERTLKTQAERETTESDTFCVSVPFTARSPASPTVTLRWSC